ncbi:hypothetical protein BJX63DRAFT_303438 [Aspergillus granulosus]|uniref:Uncharacterized protein n=1 Tax=Aspergillus granulosus TaxID=176169 RepID=A0ABR4H6A7_9EURO
MRRRSWGRWRVMISYIRDEWFACRYRQPATCGLPSAVNLTTLGALLINGLLPRKEGDIVLVGPDQNADDDEEDEEDDEDDRDGHVPLHGGRAGKSGEGDLGWFPSSVMRKDKRGEKK